MARSPAGQRASGRTNVRFPSGGSHCAAWHYPGSNGACVVMAGGLGVTKGPGTEKFAERFNAAGFDVLAFEYRRLGESGGQPRQIVNIGEQLEDWQAAIRHAHGLPGVDASRVAIWGHSVSGGHILRTAARTPHLGAAIAQAPNADGLDAFVYALRRTPILAGTRLAALALVDALGGRLGREPRLIPLTGPRGSVASLTTPDALNGQPTLNPDGRYDDWQTEIAARSAFVPVFQRFGREARRIECPLLVVACDRDGVTPPRPAYRAAAQAPCGELMVLPGGHYAAYEPEKFDAAAERQIAFLRRHLVDAADGGSPQATQASHSSIGTAA